MSLRRRGVAHDESETASLLSDSDRQANSPPPTTHTSSHSGRSSASVSASTSSASASANSGGDEGGLFASLGQFFEECWEVIATSLGLAEPPFIVDVATASRMSAFKLLATTKFSKEDPDHVQKLKELWVHAFGSEAVLDESLVDARWKHIGFQSDDPMRDFRAIGIFGVENLLFVAEKYPKSFRHFCDNESSGDYPFVITAFNITMLLFELLGWGWKSATTTAAQTTTFPTLVRLLFPPSSSSDSTALTFHELFFITTSIMDEVWKATHATYMDFPVVLKETQRQLEGVLSSVHGIEDLFDISKKSFGRG